jgi:hypothetical protein
MLGQYDDAESLFQGALSINKRLEAPYWIARTKLDYADLLVERAESDDLAKARAIVDGFGALERRASVLLRTTH